MLIAYHFKNKVINSLFCVLIFAYVVDLKTKATVITQETLLCKLFPNLSFNF